MQEKKIARGRRGFLTMEIVIFIIFLGVMTPIFLQIIKVSQNNNKITITKARVEAINAAMQRVWYENKQFAEQNCYGWQDAACSNLALTPAVTSATTLTFYTLDPNAINELRNVGCSVTGTTPSFNIQCYDGDGALMQFAGSNLHSRNTDFVTPYQNLMPQITITTTRLRTVVIGYPKAVNNSIISTQAKLNEIGNAVKQFSRRMKLAEVNNVCGTASGSFNPVGGLDSLDDAVVPFVWKAVSSNPTALCSGVEDTGTGCGCSSATSASNWETSSSFCLMTPPGSKANIQRFMRNINLSSTKYLVDGFGNGITVVPLAGATGDLISCPPPRPTNYYGTSFPAIPKTRVGVRSGAGSGTWHAYVDVISE